MQKYCNPYIAFAPLPTHTVYVNYKSRYRANSKANLRDAQKAYEKEHGVSYEFVRSRIVTK